MHFHFLCFGFVNINPSKKLKSLYYSINYFFILYSVNYRFILTLLIDRENALY